MKIQTNITWRATYIQITSKTRNTVIFKKNVTDSTWKRLHKFVVTHNPQITSHSMTAVIFK